MKWRKSKGYISKWVMPRVVRQVRKRAPLSIAGSCAFAKADGKVPFEVVVQRKIIACPKGDWGEGWRSCFSRGSQKA